MRKLVKIIIPLLLIGGLIYALDWFAVIDVEGLLHKVPVVGKFVPEPQNSVKTASTNKTTTTQVNPLDAENKKLKAQIKTLNQEVAKLNQTNDSLKSKQTEYQDIIKKYEDASKKIDVQSGGYKELAKYYANMKPQAAVQIMNNLDDDTIIGILTNLDDEQAGKILAAMDPKRAAQIVQKMT